MDRNDTQLETLWNDFHDLVTMPSPALGDWLVQTRDGTNAYATDPDVDIRALGETVSRMLTRRRVDLSDADVSAMTQAVDEIRELLENPPAEGVDAGPWRDTLRTLGHDPDGPVRRSGGDDL